ncbi:MAG: hypothetical protein JW829_20535, partial [Pirellulales bacterium]|nr:hypothetical protein [Pirellulales bacterium]
FCLRSKQRRSRPAIFVLIFCRGLGILFFNIWLIVAVSADPILLETIQADWALQDGLFQDGHFQIGAVEKSIVESGDRANDLLAEFNLLVAENAPRHDTRWIDLYHRACKLRRAVRLEASLDKIRHVVFTKHDTLGGSHYAYTEALSDAQSERNFSPGSALCLLEMDGFYAKTITLIDDPAGVIRDPDVSWDGQRILFAWKQSDRLDDYHLYEMDIQARSVRQLTFGLGFADYEPAYLPNGDILFNSTRCVQTVDCWWTEVSNLYTCDKDGKYLRRLSHDQVHTNYPTVTSDGRDLHPLGLFRCHLLD